MIENQLLTTFVVRSMPPPLVLASLQFASAAFAKSSHCLNFHAVPIAIEKQIANLPALQTSKQQAFFYASLF
ncbi:MAG: hypothetical protein IPN76_17085 [Saprospiraceae bacterium]|nr:hypothetical protein [Saprospiraceae bacterium]